MHNYNLDSRITERKSACGSYANMEVCHGIIGALDHDQYQIAGFSVENSQFQFIGNDK